MPTRNLTIMFTDIKGFTERTARSSRDYVVKVLEQQDILLKPIIAKYDGTIIKSIGDAYLVTFDSPTNAVICGLMMQHALRGYNTSVPADARIEVRVAINTGEVNLVGKDVLGDPVNVASRVEGITEANEVWFTEATYLSMNKQEVPTSEVGEFKLKGVPEAVRIYRASVDETQILYRKSFDESGKSLIASEGTQALPQSPSRKTGLIVAACALVALLCVAGIWAFGSGPANAKAAALLKEKKYPQALQMLEPQLIAAPTDAELQSLVKQAVDGEIAAMLERGEAIDARSRLDLYRGRHTFLGAMSPLLRDIRIAEVSQKAKTGKDTPADLDGLVQDYPDDASVWYFTAVRLFKQGDWGLRASMPRFKKTLELDAVNYARKPEMIAAFGKAAENLSVYELFERAPYGALLVKHFFEDHRKQIYEGLNDPKNGERRFISYRLIKAKEELGKIDLFAFFMLNLNDPNLTSKQQEETLDYFESLLPRAADAELRKKFPAKMTLFPALLSTDEKIGPRAIKIARELFREPLSEALASAQKSEDESTRAAAEQVLRK